MNAEESIAAGSSVPKARKSHEFLTAEQRLCTPENVFSTYWKKENELCRDVLEIGREPGRFELIRAFFPVVRTGVAFEFPLTEAGVPFWWTFSFYAGWQFGKSLSGPAISTLQPLDRHEIRQLLYVIQQTAGKGPINPDTFCNAFRFIWGLRPPTSDGKEVQQLILAALINAFTAGITAAVWRDECSEFPFVNVIEMDYSDPAIPLHVRSIQASAATDYGLPFVERMAHPLLKAAFALYPQTPIERAAIMPFFHGRPRKFGWKEADCPSTDLDIVDWISSGLRYGRKLKGRQPELLNALRQELGEDRFAAAVRCCQAIRSQAPKGSSLEIARAALDWHFEVCGWVEPQYYGQRLDRVVRIADLAIWMGMIGDV